MRADGIAEEFCTGKADPHAKFFAWAATVPRTLRNPLYHWTHLELQRYFGIDELLNEQSAARIWKKANEQLARLNLTARGILKKFTVTTLCTTDDPVDDLSHHKKIASTALRPRVFPAFRPDRALTVDQPVAFNAWVDRLEKAANVNIRKLDAFVSALQKRHDFFHANGCRLSDHGLNQCPALPCADKTAATIFAKARGGKAASCEEREQFATFLMLLFGLLGRGKKWVKQLHLGAARNNNTRLLATLGPDTGLDSIGDFPQVQSLMKYLDLLDRGGQLPKVIVFNNNPGTITPSLRPLEISRTARSPASCNSAPAGGFSTKKRESNGSSTRCQTLDYFRDLSAWSRIPGPSCPIRATNISAVCSAI